MPRPNFAETMMRLPTDLMERIAAFRFDRRIDTMAATIRRLLDAGLRAEAASAPATPVKESADG